MANISAGDCSGWERSRGWCLARHKRCDKICRQAGGVHVAEQQATGHETPNPTHLRCNLPRLEPGCRTAPEHLLEQRWLQRREGGAGRHAGINDGWSLASKSLPAPAAACIERMQPCTCQGCAATAQTHAPARARPPPRSTAGRRPGGSAPPAPPACSKRQPPPPRLRRCRWCCQHPACKPGSLPVCTARGAHAAGRLTGSAPSRYTSTFQGNQGQRAGEAGARANMQWCATAS